ncbi:MAG: MBL fold metallo-hydrolase [Cytophagaceae bacterium]|nr:MBL fold metallo-hydrolase [Gemmatimonadaceae bacterium]
MIVPLHAGVALGDLQHLGRPEAIAVALIDTGDGLGLVDPGPSSCREALEGLVADFGARLDDVRHVFLTHIHLDHAGIAGSLAQATPRARVYVHERGAPHLVDPTRLLDSARRIYGAEMDRLWGEFLPVPVDQLVVLQGGERLSVGTRRWRVAATPGHAVHHVAYLDEHVGVVFTGDVTGEATQHGTPALPVTPPPDIDLEAWRPSLDRILEWRPESLFLTHFGEVRDPHRHIEEMWKRLLEWSDTVRASLEHPGSDDARADRFLEEQVDALASGLEPEQVKWIEQDAIRSSWFGLARYWRKKLAPPVVPVAAPVPPA